jgi:hypothetical protein
MNTVAVYGGFAIVLGTSALGAASSAPMWTLVNLSNVQVHEEYAADSIFVTPGFHRHFCRRIPFFSPGVPNPKADPKIQT